MVDGRVLHFEARGLYDGVSLLWDRETGSLWHHITGECLSGRLAGRRLPVSNLLHTTVGAALEADPDIGVALSDQPVRRPNRWAALAAEVPVLSDLFRRTMGREDGRRPAMDVGLGVWTDKAARYYPLEDVRAAGNALLDRFTDQRLLVYLDPKARALAALYTEATEVRWSGDTVQFDTGEALWDGVLYDANGRRRAIARPLQVFTRWYGFALTFPATDVYKH